MSTPVAACERRDLRVLFVCKGLPRDGLGHVIRTRAVASAAHSRCVIEVVVIGGSIADSLLQGSVFTYAVVPDVAGATAVSHAFKPDVVVFDLLDLDGASFDEITRGSRSVTLSPVFESLALVDKVFHRTKVPDPSWRLLDKRPEFRMGLEYTVIPEQHQQISTAIYEQTLTRNRLSVAVSMGGADAANRTLEVIRTLRANRQKLLLWVLLGEGYAHSYQDLVDATRGAPHEIILAKTNDSMWHILATCAVAILAGGITTSQAVYAGLPSLNILESPERGFLVEELVSNGACLRLGDTLDASLAHLNETIEQLDAERDSLLQMHLRTRGLIDGEGARRIAEEIIVLAARPRA